MPELTQQQWKYIFTAVSSYKTNHPKSIPCYKGLNEDLSYILDIIYPYAHLKNETTDT